VKEDVFFEVKNLKTHYPIKDVLEKGKVVKALDGVSFSLKKNQTLGIVGESGCGKSTLAKTLMGLVQPNNGEILFQGKDLNKLTKIERFKTIQMIFQDPYSSLNPRKQAWRLIAEPLIINSSLSRKECYMKACDLMEKVGLRSEYATKYPHMFSGGQRQRLGIARALILNPKILICDEPVSALDVSIQAQVLNTLMELQRELELTYIFISHDLNVINHISDQILVMYLGNTVEKGKRDILFENPNHPYTKALLAASPNVFQRDKENIPLKGELPSPINPPDGCNFHERCPIATDICKESIPFLENKNHRLISCHHSVD